MKCKNCSNQVKPGRVTCSKACSVASMGKDNPFEQGRRYQSYRALARHAAKTDPGNASPNF